MPKIGEKLVIDIFGASHAEKIGVKISGFPKGFAVDMEKVKIQMARRAPGNAKYGTARNEPDIPEIISGMDDNFVTDGGIIEAVIFNKNQHSSDYDNLKVVPRPAHADYTAYVKFDGKEDMRGGGKYSGRLTAPLVFAGALCRQLLETRGITIAAHVKSIADIEDDALDNVNPDTALMNRLNSTPFAVINEAKQQLMYDAMQKMRENGDSIGGTVELVADGVPVGLGDSMFDGVEGKLAAYLYGIPAVKGVEFGLGFGSAHLTGSQNNDDFIIKDGKIKTATNNCGGILGGITNGMPLWLTVAFKPTPSIARPQNSVDIISMTETVLEIKGRHDPCIVPRAVPCVEAAVAVALCDMMMCEDLF